MLSSKSCMEKEGAPKSIVKKVLHVFVFCLSTRRMVEISCWYINYAMHRNIKDILTRHLCLLLLDLKNTLKL